MIFKFLFGKKSTTKKKSYNFPKKLFSELDPDAVEVIRKLKRRGFESYLVGGCVRDLLLGKSPKDFDIATQATPQKVSALIRASRQIGRRFKIVVLKLRMSPKEKRDCEAFMSPLFPALSRVSFLKEFEITSFRRPPELKDGKINENVFGSAFDDAKRRDFTLNALFLDPIDLKVVDFMGAWKDLKAKELRVIGDPETRLREDSMRILRALRFTGKLNLTPVAGLSKALKDTMPCLADAKKERLREELLKVWRGVRTPFVFKEYFHYEVFESVYPFYREQFVSKEKSFKDLLLAFARATELCKWEHVTHSAVYFSFMFFREFDPENKRAFKSYFELAAQELNLSKLEKETVKNIHFLIKKVRTQFQNKGRLPSIHKGNFELWAQSVYVLKVFSHAKYLDGADLYNFVLPAWKGYLSKNKNYYVSQVRKKRPRKRSRKKPVSSEK